jgi:gamma-glutamylcyclotransferase (GGCT)/AIG2-like uncharacterized protein YtfP
MQHIFVYGSLLFTEIVTGLTGKSFETKNAVLSDFRRCAVAGCDYPAIIPEKGRNVKGALLMNIDKKSIDIISFYEGDEYELLEVELFQNKEKITAGTFVWKGETSVLLSKEWDLEQFNLESKQFYIKKIVPATINSFFND